MNNVWVTSIYLVLILNIETFAKIITSTMVVLLMMVNYV